MLIALTGCGGGDSSPQLVDGSQAAKLPGELDGLNDAVLTRTHVLAASNVDRDEFAACWVPAAGDTTGFKHIAVVVERVGLRGSSLTFRTGSTLYGCDKIPNPFTAEDPDLPYGGIWCASPNGRLTKEG